MAVTHRHLLLLALLLALPTVARAAQAAEGTATVPRFEPAPCPKLEGVAWLADASCGYLVGGPGDIAPLEVNGLIAADFIRDRDIYVVSQRGTMFSEPALTCADPDA